MAQPLNITRNLGPGSQGPDVQQLQQWLKDQGFFPADQTITSNYGPITQKAVATWQEKSGIDTQGNPGYFGPISRTYVTQQSAQAGQGLSFNANILGDTPAKTSPAPTTPTTIAPEKTAAATPVSPVTPSTPAANGIPYNPSWATYGVSQDVWNSMNATQQTSVAIGLSSSLDNYAANASSLSLQDAIKSASQDPNIIAKYADMLKIDQTQLTQSIKDAQTSLSTESQKNQQEFENDRKALAEQQAAAGTAYSGFREQAQNQLAANETAVVTSSRAAAQKKVNDATSAFESKYGTAGTSPANLTFSDPFAS